jgi:glutamate N-acetyltransferase / amino-acid N-acetyltransferase
MPRGFRCASRNCGIKPAGHDLSLFVSDTDAAAAAIFTRNQFPGAPVILGREIMRGGVLRAIVVNSRVSNVATGASGVENARRMGAAAAAEVGTTPDRVLVSSTGVIGVPLPIDRIERGSAGWRPSSRTDPLVGAPRDHDHGHLSQGGVCWGRRRDDDRGGEGSGMIEPNMATMLVYIFTDAADPRPTLDASLRGPWPVLQHALGRHGHEHVGHVRDAGERAGRPGGGRRVRGGPAAAHASDDGAPGPRRRRRHQAAARPRHGAADGTDARRMAKSLVAILPWSRPWPTVATPTSAASSWRSGSASTCVSRRPGFSARSTASVVVERGMSGPNSTKHTSAMCSRRHGRSSRSISGSASATATAYGCDLTAGYVHENAAYYSS